MNWLKRLLLAGEPSGLLMVVGLGNPGQKYEGTRHNIGRAVLKRLAEQEPGAFSVWRNLARAEALVSDGQLAERPVKLVLPETFMNRSGRSVVAVVRQISDPEVIIIHDELDLPLGVVRLSYGRGAGGHNGVQSVIDSLGGKDFIRLRLGVGRPAGSSTSADTFVLERFRPEEQPTADKMLDEAVEALRLLVIEGRERAMNIVNSREQQEGGE